MSETYSIGVAGPIGLGPGLDSLRYGLKATGEYQAALLDPASARSRSLDEVREWVDESRDRELVVPHGCRGRLEVPIERDSLVFTIPHRENGPNWAAMVTMRSRKFVGQTAVGKRIFFPPLSHGGVDLPLAAQRLAFVEVVTDDVSRNPFASRRELSPDDMTVAIGVGDLALDTVRIGFGEKDDLLIFDPTRFRSRAPQVPINRWVCKWERQHALQQPTMVQLC